MSNHRSSLASLFSALCLSALVLLFFVGQANAACYLFINWKALEFPSESQLFSRLIYSGATYTQTITSACGKGFPPLVITVRFRGSYDTKTLNATETLRVEATSTDGVKATFFGVSEQGCYHNPWVAYYAKCPAWKYAPDLYLTWGLEHKGAWNTGRIPFKGVYYRPPFPQLRMKVYPKCTNWGAPWGALLYPKACFPACYV